MSRTISFIPPYIPCPYCGVHITLHEAVLLVHSDQQCPMCHEPLMPEDVDKYVVSHGA